MEPNLTLSVTKKELQHAYVRSVGNFFLSGHLYKLLKTKAGWFDIKSCLSYFDKSLPGVVGFGSRIIENYALTLVKDDLCLILSEPELVSHSESILTQSTSGKWIFVKAHSPKHQKNFVLVWSLLPNILFESNFRMEFERLETGK